MKLHQFESHQPGYCDFSSPTELSQHQHPKTKDSDKYFVGDRFHNAQVRLFVTCLLNNKSIQFPHASPLCKYHHINLNVELSAAKTSGQESLNYSKNQKRLR